MILVCSAREFESLLQDLAGKAEVLRLQAKGGSMHPFIRSGDWVHVVLCKAMKDDVAKGDIILFRKDSGLYLHRVLRKQGEGFLVKGDMSFGADGVIAIDDVLGRVTGIERGARSIDLYTMQNRFISIIISECSLFLQYPALFARNISGVGMVILSRLQSLKAYRRFIKKISHEKMIIRPAVPDDEEQLRDLYRMAGHDIRDGLARVKQQGVWLVAENNGKVLGGLTMTLYEKDPSLWLIFGLEVKPFCRGRGAGSSLVKQALARAKAAGCCSIGLFVNRNAKPALALYQKLGFKATDNIPAGFNLFSDELYLTRKINDKS